METLAKRSAPYLCARKTPIQTRDVFNGTNLETLPLYTKKASSKIATGLIYNKCMGKPARQHLRFSRARGV